MVEATSRARVWTTELVACIATGGLLGVIGPFGSFLNDGLVVRIAYWVIVFVTCGMALGLAIRISAPRAQQAGVPIWAWMPALVLAMGIPLAGITRLVAILFWPRIGDAVPALDWYGQTVLISLLCVVLHTALSHFVLAPVAVRPAKKRTEPEILRHLPPRLGSDLLCLSMEDHYVRLHTLRGSVLVLMSLNQALDELGELDGLQVHRSWWVARRAVVGLREEGRNLRLQLEGGIEAPVSRASIARLRSAGWLPTP
jgi:hypothetical protein